VEIDTQLSARPPKRDRSTLPTLMFIVSCVLLTYGFSEKNAIVQWVIPGILMISSIAWSLRPTGGSRTPGMPT